MPKHPVIIECCFFILFLCVLTPRFAQNASTGPDNSEKERRRTAIGLVRTINITEAVYKTKYHSYAQWQALLSDQQEFFNTWLARFGPQQPNVRFAQSPEILPGWNLRRNVHADGPGYDLLLRDPQDRQCGYAILTDESGVIRQSKAIDCDI
jgi:hypothetical protein